MLSKTMASVRAVEENQQISANSVAGSVRSVLLRPRCPSAARPKSVQARAELARIAKAVVEAKMKDQQKDSVTQLNQVACSANREEDAKKPEETVPSIVALWSNVRAQDRVNKLMVRSM